MAWKKFAEGVRKFAPDASVEFERIAVTPEQIETMNLPTRPTKTSDSRSKSFQGDSVEADAIPAPVLRELTDEAITRHVDQHRLEVTQMAEESERSLLFSLSQGRTA